MAVRQTMVTAFLLLAALGRCGQAQSAAVGPSIFHIGGTASSWLAGGNGTDPLLCTGTRSRPRVDTTNAPGAAIDFTYRPGWIGPLHFDPEVNVASRVLEEGARISAPNVMEDPGRVVRAMLKGIVDGDHGVAFERKPTDSSPHNPLGIWIILDFGRPLGVHRIRFYPRNTVVSMPSRPYQSDYLHAFELFVNPTQTSHQRSPDRLLDRRTPNEDPVVDIAFAPQYLRLIKLKSLTEIPWEIDELEVYATGFLQQATYISDIIDLGDRATLGHIRWMETTLGKPIRSQMTVRVRTGTDATPLVFERRVLDSLGVFRGQTEVVDGSEFVKLSWREQQSISDDMENWSPWKTVDNGGIITAPGQRRYIQFQMDFQGALFDARYVNWLRFDYLTPPLADGLTAEIYPRLVAAEKRATFHYGVRLHASGPVRGFDRLEVDTNAQVENLRALTVDGRTVPFRVERTEKDGFTLSFPLLRNDGSVLQFVFDVPVFRFGTTFTGRAFNSRYAHLPQRLTPGDAVRFAADDVAELSGLSVAIPRAQVGKLIGKIVLPRKVITPNQDGVNDVFEILFNLLQLTRPTPVNLEIYDVRGRRVCIAQHRELDIGPTRYTWDGRTATGNLAAPGTYVWMLRVRADAFQERHCGVLAVIY